MACCDQITDRGGGGGVAGGGLQIDEAYEFSAPSFFDFANGESEEDVRGAELWFESAKNYAPSPFMMRIKGSRFAQSNGHCIEFGDVEKTTANIDLLPQAADTEINVSICPEEEVQSLGLGLSKYTGIGITPKSKKEKDDVNFLAHSVSNIKASEAKEPSLSSVSRGSSKILAAKEVCTPKLPRVSAKSAACSGSKLQTVKGNASLRAKPSSTSKPRDYLLPHKSTKASKPKTVPRCSDSLTAKAIVASDLAQENQAIKRQKLDDGRTRQILNIKNRVLHHKCKPELTSSLDITATAINNHEEVAPYISMAEMVKLFESKTREMEFSQNYSRSREDIASMIQRRPRLALTRPKEPEFETAHRVRAVRIKSSVELEEEMLAKIPKFKARPLNKKILESPALPALPRSIPQLPEFKEFHLITMERANQHAEAQSVASSTESACHQTQSKVPKLTAPRPPVLETSLRARPPRVKPSDEIELEELEKAPKFKARPLNRKILESKGDPGLFSNPKRQLTIPQEFHFVTDERLGPPQSMGQSVLDLFDKLSLQSNCSDQREFPRITIPGPFNLRTEERGLEKERRLAQLLLQKKIEEDKSRIPKAKPYPYSTDYPVIPPKPEPKSCTKPEAFQLESLVRHEEELQKFMEAKKRMEEEDAQKRIFRAQPIIKEDPIPLPEKVRKPLTEVQEIILHVDNRAVDRAHFDKKVKEKEATYKRQREENEHAWMIEEEKALKLMRKDMVPHARPLPSFDNPFLPQKSSRGTTKAKSPVLLVAKREERRRQHMR